MTRTEAGSTLRDGCSVVDLSWAGRLELRGRDRNRFLNGLVTANVKVTFLLQGAAPVEKLMTVGGTSRGGFCACQFTELLGQSFGILVESDQPIISERAMYFGSNPCWSAGSESAGVTAPESTTSAQG